MIEFNRLTLEDINRIKKFFTLSVSRTCDNTVGGSFMWRDFFGTEYALHHDTLTFRVRYLSERTAFSMPLGRDVDGLLREIRLYCRTHNIPMIICTASAEDVGKLASLYKIKATQEKDWSDYLYRAEDLAFMKGRKYNGQRNHMNRFRKENASYSFLPIDSTNIPAVIRFFGEYSGRVSKANPIFKEEQKKVLEVLENYETYGMTGTVLFAGGKTAAFAVGEILADTLYVHIEKADTEIAGAYQMIVSEFVKQNLDKGIVYVNREEDVGDEGLRKSKLSYHPCRLLEKYTVEIKDEY